MGAEPKFIAVRAAGSAGGVRAGSGSGFRSNFGSTSGWGASATTGFAAAGLQPNVPPPAPQNPPPQAPGAPPPGRAVAPPTLALPAGAVISVRTSQWLSSDQNHPGDIFSAVLDQPVIANGFVVARRGQAVTGRVAVALKAGQNKGVSQLGLEITALTLVDGDQLPVSTEMQQVAPSRYSQYPPGRDVATVATTTAIGTIVGAAVGRGVGAAIGAGIGATTGAAIVLSTRSRPTVIAPETLVSFRLQSPATVSTDKGPVAFRPVSQADYPDQDAYANGPRRAPYGPGYPPPSYYYGYYAGYPYCGWYCYGPYVGYWGPAYFGFGGPRFGAFGRFR